MSRNIKLLRCPGTPSVPNVLRHDIQDSGWSPGGLEPRGPGAPGELQPRGPGVPGTRWRSPGCSWQSLWEIVANTPDHDGGAAGAAARRRGMQTDGSAREGASNSRAPRDTTGVQWQCRICIGKSGRTA